MILGRTTLSRIGSPFRDATVTVDWSALGEGVHAIHGVNGSGKTTLIEAPLAAIFRDWPSRNARGFAACILPGVRDAYVDSTFTLGDDEYRALVQCDPQFGGGRGKTEAFLHKNAAPIAGPNVREFDAAIARILPSSETTLASVFAAQGKRGAEASFFGLSREDRRALFVELLGIGEYERKSEAAGLRAKAQLARLEDLRRRREALGAQAVHAAELAVQLATFDHEIPEVRRLVDEARAALAAAVETRTARQLDCARLETTVEAIVARNAERNRILSDRATERIRLSTSLAEIEQHLGEVPALEARVASLPDLERRLTGYERHQEEARTQRDTLTPLQAADEATLTHLRAEYDRVDAEHAKAVEARAFLAELGDVAGQLTQGEAHAETLRAKVETARTNLATAEEALKDAEAGVTRRRVVDDAIADHGRRGRLLDQLEQPDNALCQRCVLTQEARAAVSRIETELRPQLAGCPMPEALITARAARDNLRTALQKRQGELTEADRRLSTLREGARRAAAAEGLAGSVDRLAAALTDIRAKGMALKETVTARATELQKVTFAYTSAMAEVHKAKGERAAAEAARERLGAIAVERGQAAGLRDALARLDALPVEDLETVPDLEAAQRAVRVAEAAVTHAETVLATETRELEEDVAARERLAGEAAALGDVSAQVAALDQEERALTADISDWHVVRDDLGREGLQALDIDIAGPSVSAICNDLLGTCWGPRFTLKLKTLGEKKDGTAKEVFDVTLFDAETGRIGTEGSGGENVVFEEALRLAIALFNAERAALTGFAPLRTLWRDETDGDLDVENAHRYLQMLRRAREIGRFHAVYFITHRPALWESADGRLTLDAGHVESDPPGAVVVEQLARAA